MVSKSQGPQGTWETPRANLSRQGNTNCRCDTSGPDRFVDFDTSPRLFIMSDNTPTRMETRAGNATAHPGLVMSSRKRTRDDGKTKKDAAREREQAKEEKQKAKVLKIARLEQRMAKDEETVSITPKPQSTNDRKLRRTRCYAQIPLTRETVPDSNDSGSNDDGEDMHEGDTEPNTTDHEAPPKKKSKKIGFRDAVRKYLQEENESDEDDLREAMVSQHSC